MTRQRYSQRSSAVYLVYLLFLFFQPLFDPSTVAATWIATGVMTVVFLPVYLWTFPRCTSQPYLWSRERRRPGAVLGIIAMVAIGVASIPINSGATTFLVYAAAAGGALRPRRRALTVLALVMATALVTAFTSSIPFPYVLAAFAPAFLLVPVLGLSVLFQRERIQTDARLAMAQDEIEHLAAIAERERIARDLHDLLGHTLSTITLKSELAHHLALRRPGARRPRDARGGTHLARRPRRGAQRRRRLPSARLAGRAGQRQAGAGGRRGRVRLLRRTAGADSGARGRAGARPARGGHQRAAPRRTRGTARCSCAGSATTPS